MNDGYKRICQFYSARSTKKRQSLDSYIFLQYYPMTLKDVMTNGESFTIDFCLKTIRQLLQGVFYMHSFNISHNDLKLENIVAEIIDNKLHIKIIDFGGARFLLNNELYFLTNNKAEKTTYYVSSSTTAHVFCAFLLYRHV